jgi:hypothetical protein
LHPLDNLSDINSATMASSSFTPLSQAFSGWLLPEHATILVSDSIESDGRFVLHTLAAAAASAATSSSSSSSHHVLWFCCGAVTDQLTLSSLKRMLASGSGSGGGDKASLVASASLPDGINTQKIPPPSVHASAAAADATSTAEATTTPTSSTLTIRSVPSLMDKFLLSESIETKDEEWLARMLLGIVHDWVLTRRQHGSLLILWDDVSTLASIMGENLTYGLLVSIQALSTMTRPLGLVVRYSHDVDVAWEESPDAMWLGGGGNGGNGRVESCGLPWERNLVELADVLIDVTPLPSGVTRHAHGRLYITGRTMHVASVYNYCLTDQAVLAMRM